MGTIIIINGEDVELNDTLQITSEQGWPKILDWKAHQSSPLTSKMFEEEIFTFKDKPGKRIFHKEGIRVFLVENRDGKWIYWGLVHILKTSYDPGTDTTSGKFRIIHIYYPQVMKVIHRYVDRNPETDYFGVMQSE